VDLVQAFATAWGSQDPDQVMPFYSNDIEAYDASMYGQVFDYSEVESVLTGDPYQRDRFVWEMDSFFVSDDGRFAALIGTFKDGNTITPCMSLVEFKDNQIVWEYDYYGGALSDEFALPEIPASASQLAASKQVITETKTMLSDWEAAYNHENAQDVISYYADQASFTYITGPQWVVFTKDQLLDDLMNGFSSEHFSFQLDKFYLSSDGHFAAVQGIYADEFINESPMITLLEIENGEIVEQYVYIDGFTVKNSNQPSEQTGVIENMVSTTLTYVAFGDSTVVIPGIGMMGYYKEMLAQDLGVEINLVDRSFMSGGAPRLISLLDKPELREELGKADVITLQIPTHQLEGPMRLYFSDPEACGGEDNQDCLREAFNQYKQDTDLIFAKLMEVVNPTRQIIRAQDTYLFNVTAVKRVGNFEVYNRYWQDAQKHIHATAAKYGVPVARVYDAFMGPDGSDDPAEKGLMSDITHASSKGAKLMAQLIRELGYSYASGENE
jgi:lysophospholipase L1-like esterase/ketosteroid isomerase-like protein